MRSVCVLCALEADGAFTHRTPGVRTVCCISSIFNDEEDMQTESGTGAPAARPAMDQETLDFIRGVFGLVRAGDSERMGTMIAKGMPVNFRNEKGDSLIMLACYHGHLETARLLLDAGADPNVANDQGQTPLAGVAYKGFTDIAELLLAHGALVEGASPDGKTPLMMAAMFNRPAILELLLAHGASADAVDSRGMTALSLARSMGAADTQAKLEAME